MCVEKLNLHIHVDRNHMEGTVSQIFDIGPSLDFIKCRKLSAVKSQNSSSF